MFLPLLSQFLFWRGLIEGLGCVRASICATFAGDLEMAPAKEKKKKVALGFGESLRLLAKDPYILCLAGMVRHAHATSSPQPPPPPSAASCRVTSVPWHLCAHWASASLQVVAYGVSINLVEVHLRPAVHSATPPATSAKSARSCFESSIGRLNDLIDCGRHR